MLMTIAFSGQATIVKEPSVHIQCLSGSMLITIKNAPASYEGLFSGMVYPKGLAKNSTCLSEYRFVSQNSNKIDPVTNIRSLQGPQRPYQI